jgi:hypothetical protein
MSLPFEKECVIVCKGCNQVAYDVYRKPTEAVGVYEHVRDPEPDPRFTWNCPQCGGKLERG